MAGTIRHPSDNKKSYCTQSGYFVFEKVIRVQFALLLHFRNIDIFLDFRERFRRVREKYEFYIKY